MKKILILGNKGMLGHVVERHLKEQKKYEIRVLNRLNLDMRNFTKLDNDIAAINPDVVINCVGMLAGRCKDENRIVVADINVALPRMLAHISQREKHPKFKLIHISTNCVFKDIGPHDAEETPDATNLYGYSKGLGEISEPNLTIRTSIIGPELKKDGEGLFDWFKNNSPKELSGFTNAQWNGVTTLQLAIFIDECIKKNTVGLINYFTTREKSKFEILGMINELYDLKKTINAEARDGVHSSLLKGAHYTDKTIRVQLTELKEWY